MGPDNILAIALNTCASEPAAPLARLIQYSYNTVIYLIKWKIAQVYPVHKKQDKSNLDNYSSISLCPIIRKVLEGVITNTIKQHLLSNNLLSDAQFGFRQ
eukprot:g18107.t1